MDITIYFYYTKLFRKLRQVLISILNDIWKNNFLFDTTLLSKYLKSKNIYYY